MASSSRICKIKPYVLTPKQSIKYMGAYECMWKKYK